ncbi:hypothetical protein HKX48_000146 [Thoreauomyces humboldtii]|nr:hypothetical protein HKX48_000146 [Thoreauomyces humboldtii]
MEDRRAATTNWSRDFGRPPKFFEGNLFERFHVDGRSYCSQEQVLWIFSEPVPLEAVTCVLQALGETVGDTVRDDADGTLFSFTFVSRTGSKLRRENIIASIDEMLSQLVQKSCREGVELVPFSAEQQDVWTDLRLEQDVVSRVANPCHLLAEVHVDGKSGEWSPDNASSLLGIYLVKLRRDSDFVSRAIELPSWDRFPLHLVMGHHAITWNGSVFFDSHDRCTLQDSHARLVPLTSVDRYPKLKDYASLVQYLYYRLQVHNSTFNHQREWPEIRFPLTKAGDLMMKPRARILLFKREQAMKTPLSVALMWAYTFVRGFTVAAVLRNLGARQTGLVGLRERGIASINDLISVFIRDVRDEIFVNGWDVEQVTKMMSLTFKDDQEMKWGENRKIARTRQGDQRRVEQLKNEVQLWVRTPGAVLALPMNVRGLDFFFDDSLKYLDDFSKMTMFIDEADEQVSSYDRNGTRIETAQYPKGAGNYDHETPPDSEDSEDMKFSTELFKDRRMQVVAHIVGVTATPVPILFTNHDTEFCFFDMPVAPNYIGRGTPDYCINKVQLHAIPPRPSRLRRSLYSGTTPKEWWKFEKKYLKPIFKGWGDSELFQAALICTSASTRLTILQKVGARAIAQFAGFPIAAVANNGRSSTIYLSSHFAALNQHKILTKLNERLEGSDSDSGHGGGRDVFRFGIPERFDIRDDNGAVYKRRHPSVLIEVGLAAFACVDISNVRCVFLETEAICGRERTYASFSRTEVVKDLYYHFPAGRKNVAITSRVLGRVKGVELSLDPDRRRRRAWMLDPVIKEVKKYGSLIVGALAVWQKHPGLTLHQINDRMQQQDMDEDEAEAWDRCYAAFI